MAVVVVTDSAANLPAQYRDQLNITVAPLHVLVGEQSFQEGTTDLDIDYTAHTVTTSAPAPAELAAVYTQAWQRSAGDGVLVIHLSRLLSGTWAVAEQVIQDLDLPRIRLVDSLGAGLATGLSALAAAQHAAAGHDLDSVYTTAVDAAQRTRTLILVNRTEQLRRGGRLSSAAAFFGSELVSRPLLQLTGGKLELREKVRTRSKAYATLVAAAADAAGAEATVAVQHLGAAAAAETISAQLRERIPRLRDLITAEFGPTLGAHLGVGALGVAVLPH